MKRTDFCASVGFSKKELKEMFGFDDERLKGFLRYIVDESICVYVEYSSLIFKDKDMEDAEIFFGME